MKPFDDKRKAPSYYGTAEKRAYMQGYRHARYGVAMLEAGTGIRRKWPQAYTKGFWEGYALGCWEGYPTKE